MIPEAARLKAPVSESINRSSAMILTTSAINMSCEPNDLISLTLHSIEMGESATMGQFTIVAAAGVRPLSLNLSKSRPDFTPHQSVAVSYTHLRAHETRHDLVCR